MSRGVSEGPGSVRAVRPVRQWAGRRGRAGVPVGADQTAGPARGVGTGSSLWPGLHGWEGRACGSGGCPRSSPAPPGPSPSLYSHILQGKPTDSCPAARQRCVWVLSGPGHRRPPSCSWGWRWAPRPSSPAPGTPTLGATSAAMTAGPVSGRGRGLRRRGTRRGCGQAGAGKGYGVPAPGLWAPRVVRDWDLPPHRVRHGGALHRSPGLRVPPVLPRLLQRGHQLPALQALHAVQRA